VARQEKTRLVQVGTLPVVRVTTGLDGLPPGASPIMEYHTTAMFFARGAGYMITVNGADRDGAAIERLVDALGATVKLAAPIREPQRAQVTWAGRAGGVVGWLLCAGVVGAALRQGWQLRKRKTASADERRRDR
jgi:hypothetical protein